VVFCKNSCREDKQHLDQNISPLRAVEKLFASVAGATTFRSEISESKVRAASSQEPWQKSHDFEPEFSCFSEILQGERA